MSDRIVRVCNLIGFVFMLVSFANITKKNVLFITVATYAYVYLM